eukprot:18372-Heterococcus_DN1.PRE.3
MPAATQCTGAATASAPEDEANKFWAVPMELNSLKETCKVLARVKQGHANIAVVAAAAAAAALRTAPNMVLDYYSYYSVTI